MRAEKELWDEDEVHIARWRTMTKVERDGEWAAMRGRYETETDEQAADELYVLLFKLSAFNAEN